MLETSEEWWCKPVIPAALEVDHGPRLAWEKAQDPIWKKTKSKRSGFVAEVVESLPSKCKALSSNPSTTKKKKKKKCDL
jgi:hypothetical protein